MKHELDELFKFESPPHIDRGNAPSLTPLKINRCSTKQYSGIVRA
jgi:hypothetical protein